MHCENLPQFLWHEQAWSKLLLNWWQWHFVLLAHCRSWGRIYRPTCKNVTVWGYFLADYFCQHSHFKRWKRNGLDWSNHHWSLQGLERVFSLFVVHCTLTKLWYSQGVGSIEAILYMYTELKMLALILHTVETIPFLQPFSPKWPAPISNQLLYNYYETLFIGFISKLSFLQATIHKKRLISLIQECKTMLLLEN